MRIRKATLADAAEIARVGIVSWNETFRGIVPDSFLDRMDLAERTQWATDYLNDPNVEVYTVVAEEEEMIVGYAAGGPNRWTDDVYGGELFSLYLLRKMHRRGIGRQLVQAVAQGLVRRGYTNMLVGVLRDNPARAFYERLGAVYVKEGAFIVDGVEILELAYGWPDLRVLLPEHEGR
jgi:GNAT superfamily N-acetyltransferase